MYKLPKITKYKKEIEEIKEICIFGYGILGKAVADLILDMGIKIKYIYDNNSSKWGLEYRGIEVVSPSEIIEHNVPIVVCTFEYIKEITHQLKKNGVTKILPYYFCFNSQIVDKEFYWNNDSSIQEAFFVEKRNSMNNNDGIILQCLDIAITEMCSLKCKECANLMQFYKNPKEGDYELNRKALIRLFEVVDLVGRVSLLGGEPLTCKELYKYIKFCNGVDKLVNILVVTNGTILPDDSVINAIKEDDRTVISLSDYGELSKRKQEIINLSEEKKFKISISRRDGIWRELGKIEYIEKSKEELIEKYNICENKKFITMKDGKLYRCPFIANAHSLKAMKECDIDYINLIDDNLDDIELRQKIKTLLDKKYYNGCKYCSVSGKDAKKIPAAIQIKKPKGYKEYI